MDTNTNPAYKRTMVSVHFRGRQQVLFVYLPLMNGQPVMSMLALSAQFPGGIPNGATFTVG